MFEQLTNLKSVRSNTNALGFYLAYLFLGLLLGGLAGALTELMPEWDYNTSLLAGNVIAVAFVLAICLKISHIKKLGLMYYALSILAAILAVYGGCLLGLIPASYMSTLNINNIE